MDRAFGYGPKSRCSSHLNGTKTGRFSSVVEQEHGKLQRNVQFIHSAPYDSLAQLVEHLTFNQRVGRSNRLRITINIAGGWNGKP